MSQCRVPRTGTGSLGNRLVSTSSSRPGPTRPIMVRPLEAPRSMAATTADFMTPLPCRRLAQEPGRDAGVDGDVQPGRPRQLSRGEHEHGVGDVLRQYLALEQGALGVVLAELVLCHAV